MEQRILFVASEPNGEQPNGGIPDMGDWFRTANEENNYHGNPQFFMRCVIMLNGINGKCTGQAYVKNDADFNNFRFMDLKATQGSPQADPTAVSDYVEENMNNVIQYFNSTDTNFGLSPHIIVLLGNPAQSIFISCIRDKVVNNENLKWIAMPHPSHTVGYEGLEFASKKIRKHLQPINQQQVEKWIYDKNKFDNWRRIS
jgi:hypothetical protein